MLGRGNDIRNTDIGTGKENRFSLRASRGSMELLTQWFLPSDADCELLTSGTVKNKFLQFQVLRLLPSSSEETKHSILANAYE